MPRDPRTIATTITFCLAMLLASACAHAAEGGTCAYPLGRAEPLMGLRPAPGIYLVNDVYYYTGKAGYLTSSVDPVADSIEAERLVNYLSLNWMTEVRLGSGDLGVWLTLPYGREEVSWEPLRHGAGRAPSRATTSDDVTGVGDLALGGSVAWRTGVSMWSGYGMVFMPTGDYDQNRAANMGLNRWAFDVGTAGRWGSPMGGREFATVLGLTINTENPDTSYKTGVQLHADLAYTQRFESGFSVGIIGYHYRQLTADGGSGAPPGERKGRVTSVGAAAGYEFAGGVGLGLRYYYEFWAKNWLEGNALYATLSIPF